MARGGAGAQRRYWAHKVVRAASDVARGRLRARQCLSVQMFSAKFRQNRLKEKIRHEKNTAHCKIHARFVHELARFMSFSNRAFSSFPPVCSRLSTDHRSRSYARKSVSAFRVSFPLLPQALERYSSMATGRPGRARASIAPLTRSRAEICCLRRSTCTRTRSWRPPPAGAAAPPSRGLFRQPSGTNAPTTA